MKALNLSIIGFTESYTNVETLHLLLSNSPLTCVFLCFFRMNEMGLSPTENKVYFGQLLGMCDQISFPLGMWCSAWLLKVNSVLQNHGGLHH